MYEGIGLRDPGDRDPDDDLDLQLTGPRTTPDQEPPVQGPVQDDGQQTRRSQGVVQGGPGSSPLYLPQDQTPAQEQPGLAELSPGDIVRSPLRRGRRYKVKALEGEAVHVWELEAGITGAQRMFMATDLVLVDRRQSQKEDG